MDSPEFLFRMKVPASMIDALGHVNNAHYLTLYELGRWDVCKRKNFDLPDMLQKQRSFVILEVHLQYLKELTEGDPILIRTRFLNIDRKVWIVEQSIEKAEGILASKAHFKAALFDLTARRIVTPDAAWQHDFLQPLPEVGSLEPTL